jgi:hypothetical protein
MRGIQNAHAACRKTARRRPETPALPSMPRYTTPKRVRRLLAEEIGMPAAAFATAGVRRKRVRAIPRGALPRRANEVKQQAVCMGGQGAISGRG